jgi:[NiFe]-hydrogenase assembly, chaperone, HybE
MSSLDDVTAGVRKAFEQVHREQFLGDRAANPRLTVEVIDAAIVDNTPTVVLITPWTINGLAFPPDDEFPEVLDIAARRRPVFRVEMPGLGAFRSVNLPVEAASLSGMDQARTLSHSWAAHFHDAVRAARQAGAAGT